MSNINWLVCFSLSLAYCTALVYAHHTKSYSNIVSAFCRRNVIFSHADMFFWPDLCSHGYSYGGRRVEQWKTWFLSPLRGIVYTNCALVSQFWQWHLPTHSNLTQKVRFCSTIENSLCFWLWALHSNYSSFLPVPVTWLKLSVSKTPSGKYTWVEVSAKAVLHSLFDSFCINGTHPSKAEFAQM